ncbi:AbiH family protein [Chryseobacterium sp. WLY505]|uniref:AbiH family protein n=1 Tax=Chryseobacterium sp. WLY505 TaxID=3068892 RepID=UPI002796B416|nr:AbiH family protein [Chryseobacterium sp. WLY505]MDQ1859015.1 AbiH family protein [Chryseobacterium sp. WLY505]
MNRLVIIGNGFDLAHGLPTSYRSFLDWIWQNFSEINNSDLFQNLFNINISHFTLQNHANYSAFCDSTKASLRSSDYNFYDSHYGSSSFKIYYKHPYFDEYPSMIFEFKNSFFELITVQNAENWVDIENTYYQVLLSLVNNDKKYPQIESIERLNSEFSEIKILLEHYLNSEVNDKYAFTNKYEDLLDILELLRYKEYSPEELKKLQNEFPANYKAQVREFLRDFKSENILKNYIFSENLFLDFNYTKNVENYVRIINEKKETLLGRARHIQIHGKLMDLENPINFGFGDEMDDHYKVLENTGNNKFLENIKSFMYFNNSNYRQLLNWIEGFEYQIYIMGHSCGLSDRTLLNTLFEHQNCKSIKIFYHQKSDGTDNFTELSQNISRHFNKKSLMREKVVDKSLSRPLPQNVRYCTK